MRSVLEYLLFLFFPPRGKRRAVATPGPAPVPGPRVKKIVRTSRAVLRDALVIDVDLTALVRPYAAVHVRQVEGD